MKLWLYLGEGGYNFEVLALVGFFDSTFNFSHNFSHLKSEIGVTIHQKKKRNIKIIKITR